MGGQRYVVFLLLLVCAMPVLAEDQVIVNSQDWRDVYSGVLYGELSETPAKFLVSTKHSTIILYSIPTDRDEVLIVTNRGVPFIAGYESILQSRGYANADEIRTDNGNLELLERLEGVRKFIVLDDAYGYNAISVAPYAAISKSYVVFANKNNIDDVVDVLQDKDPESVMIYGQVDRVVKDELAQFNPETINKRNRFENNIEIVNRYLELNPTKQVILTNGEFIEQSLMTGADPIVFLGRENVPEVVREFIDTAEIDVGILIGNELVNSATFVRRALGISVFVKFAQGARQPTGSIAQVEDLDRFPMPTYDLAIEITSIVYNKATGALEVTYHNPTGLAEYFKSTITIRDGIEVVVIGDERAVFLDKNEYKTIVYRVDVDGNPLQFESDELSGDAFVVFGESPQSLENQYQKTFSIDIIEVLDDAQIEIKGLYYDKVTGSFYVIVENIGKVDAYISAELIDIIVNDQPLTVGSADVLKLGPGKTGKIQIEVEMDEQDFLDNAEIRVRAYYGERELSRVKITEETLPLEFKSSLGRYVIYGIVILLILLLLFFLGTKKKCPHCGYKNPRGRKTCLHCGKPFKQQPGHPGHGHHKVAHKPAHHKAPAHPKAPAHKPHHGHPHHKK